MERLQTRGIRPKSPYDLNSTWADYRLPSTDELAHREIAVTLDDGRIVEFVFDEDTVNWKTQGQEKGDAATYDAVAARENVYFVTFLHRDNLAATALALNLNTNGGVLVANTLVRGADRTDLQQDLYPCSIGDSKGTTPELSAELVGKRAYAEYGDGNTAEHVYFNPRRFVWQGLGKFDYSGSECDHSTTWKLDDQLFLLTWVEEWQAVSAVLLMDFKALRNVGVLFGQDDNGLLHTLVGARLKMLGQITYPKGYEPAGTAGPSAR
ncbi:MAG: MoaF C-terminal domain-containing protein [Acidimicrobiales bacterium]|jgi:hypothetical protein